MSSKYEKKSGKYYVYINGVRHQVSKETYMQSQEEDRQEKISKMTEKDRKKREKTKEKGYYVESKKNTIRLTESELKRIITESVKRVLIEGNENVITIGSSEYGEQGFRVELGDGGLGIKQFNVYAYNEQEALDAAVDYAEKKGWNFLFWDDDESVEEYPDDFISVGNHSHQLRSGDFIVRPLNESYRRRNRQ